MGRLVRWVAGLLSIAALAKLLERRRSATSTTPPEPDPGPDPAEELRRKLADVRATAPESAAATTAPLDAPGLPDTVSAADPTEPTIEERRAAIHARAQEAIDVMKASDA